MVSFRGHLVCDSVQVGNIITRYFDIIVCPHGETGPKNTRHSEGAAIERADGNLLMAWTYFNGGVEEGFRATEFEVIQARLALRRPGPRREPPDRVTGRLPLGRLTPDGHVMFI